MPVDLATIALECPLLPTPMESVAEVLVADDIAPELRRLILATSAVQQYRWQLGQTVDVMVERGVWRTYMIADLDPELRRLELIMSSASGGPGAFWAGTTGPGDEVRLRGPVGDGLLDPAASRHLLVGDETALGLAMGLSRARPSLAIGGVLEVPAWSSTAVVRLKLPFEIVVRRPGSPGTFAARVLDAMGIEPGDYHVVGSSAFVARIQRVLAAESRATRSIVTWTEP